MGEESEQSPNFTTSELPKLNLEAPEELAQVVYAGKTDEIDGQPLFIYHQRLAYALSKFGTEVQTVAYLYPLADGQIINSQYLPALGIPSHLLQAMHEVCDWHPDSATSRLVLLTNFLDNSNPDRYETHPPDQKLVTISLYKGLSEKLLRLDPGLGDIKEQLEAQLRLLYRHQELQS